MNRDPFPTDSHESSAPAEGVEHWSESGSRRYTEDEWRHIQQLGREMDREQADAAEEKTPAPVKWAKKHVGIKSAAAVAGVLLVNAFALGGLWRGIAAHAQEIDRTAAKTEITAEGAKAAVLAVEKKNAEDHAAINAQVARVAQAVDDQVAQSKATNARLDQVVQLLVQVAGRRSAPEPSPAPPKKAPQEPQR